ncbi:hypothetical protein [Dactylosporangium sp. CA-139066]|uniref:hypothetical protein n=1 Tax=Dactylosporangium sp. CA-139066 TaxID=3239930 RepID=UPI003D93547A
MSVLVLVVVLVAARGLAGGGEEELLDEAAAAVAAIGSGPRCTWSPLMVRPPARVIDAEVSGTVEAAETSRLGAGFLDVTIASNPREPLPTGALGILGWYLDALHDRLRGRFGARAPFRLVWHDSAVARERLVAGYDRRPRRTICWACSSRTGSASTSVEQAAGAAYGYGLSLLCEGRRAFPS